MAQIWEYIKIALMNIKSNKGRSILTMLGIIIGISSVIMIISIGDSIKGGINDTLNSALGGQIFVYANYDNEEGIYIEFDNEDLEALEEHVKNIKAVTPYNQFSGTVLGRKGNFDCILSAGSDGLQYLSSEPIIKGRYFNRNDYYVGNKVCVLSESSAKQLFGSTNVIGMTIDITVWRNTVEFTIIGIRKDEASNSILSLSMGTEMEIPLTAMEAFYGIPFNMYDQIMIVGEGAENSVQIAKDSIKLLENRHNVRDKNAIALQSFSDFVDSLDEVVSYVTLFIVLVAAISLVVGGIGVMNIMLVSVTERTREIGIRKALGARTSSILLQFLSESAIITLLGGIIGILLGVLGAMGVCSIMNFSVKVEMNTVLIASLFSASVGIFFGIYPARKAARLSPIEALRHE